MIDVLIFGGMTTLIVIMIAFIAAMNK